MSVYWRTVNKLDRYVPLKLKPFWNAEAGPKTIFFWAPAVKWCLVVAGIGDLQRPAHKLSTTQSTALAATGVIWSRYSMVIKPKNYSLFAVNIFVAITGIIQLARIYNYRKSLTVAESSK
ncbi:mitochondrial pyruvate carrier 2-like [Watersipora subatra]|uniref:mitochondrial pyruvate carrier 2-like n=1 Tax=Watersipora subatra TaxID=2589382 RepID=UPI00355BCB3F